MDKLQPFKKNNIIFPHESPWAKEKRKIKTIGSLSRKIKMFNPNTNIKVYVNSKKSDLYFICEISDINIRDGEAFLEIDLYVPDEEPT